MKFSLFIGLIVFIFIGCGSNDTSGKQSNNHKNADLKENKTRDEAAKNQYFLDNKKADKSSFDVLKAKLTVSKEMAAEAVHTEGSLTMFLATDSQGKKYEYWVGNIDGTNIYKINKLSPNQ